MAVAYAVSSEMPGNQTHGKKQYVPLQENNNVTFVLCIHFFNLKQWNTFNITLLITLVVGILMKNHLVIRLVFEATTYQSKGKPTSLEPLGLFLF